MRFAVLTFFVIVSFALTKMMIPVFSRIFIDAGFIKPNFRGLQIPLGIGVVFYAASALVITVGRLVNIFGTEAHLFLFAAGATTLFGLIDDFFGNKQASGLAGHFKKMITQGEVTTGALKAIAGGCLALAVSIELNISTTGGFALILLDAMVIALSTNLINLLDLRPGRAGKCFMILALLLSVITINRQTLVFLAIFTGSLAAILPLDLRAKVMMGDAGSNTLGFVLGFSAVTGLDITAKLIYLVILAAIHLLTEKYSLTRLIENNRLLNYIDLLGRK